MREWTADLRTNPTRVWEVCGPTATAMLVTDASMTGWGAEYFAANGEVRSTGGPWSPELLLCHPNIAELEGRAVVCGLLAFGDGHTGTDPAPLELVVDNTTVMYATIKGHSRSFWLNEQVKEIEKFRIASIRYVESPPKLRRRHLQIL